MIRRQTFWSLAVMLIMLVTVPFANASDDVHFGGLVSQGALYSTNHDVLGTDSKNGTSDYTEVMFHAIANPAPKLRVAIQFYSRNLGAEGRFDTSIDYAYLDYKVNNYIGLRAGKVKWDRGSHNLTRDVDMLRNTVFLPFGSYTENYRAFASSFQGFQIYGSLNLNALGSFDYNASVGKLSVPREYYEDINVDKFHCVKLSYNTPIEGLRFSVSEFTLNVDIDVKDDVLGDVNSFMKNEYATMFSMEYDWNRLELDAEFSKRPIESTTSFTHPALGSVADTKEINPASYYMQAGYRILDPLAINFYYEQFYTNWDDKDGKKAIKAGADAGVEIGEYQIQQKTMSFAVRYDINSNWLVKAEVQMNNGTAGLDGGSDPGPAGEEDWMLYALRTTVYF